MSSTGPVIKAGPQTGELTGLQLPISPEKTGSPSPENAPQSKTEKIVELSSTALPSPGIKRSEGPDIKPTERPLVAKELELGIKPEHKLEQGNKETKSEIAPAGRSHGIIKDPFFAYRGGPFNRIITFLANILKVIEQIILGRLYGKKTQVKIKVQTPEPVAQPTQQISKPTKRSEEGLSHSWDNSWRK